MEEHADGDNDLGRFMDIDAVLSSTTQLKISNAGGEIFELVKEALQDEKKRRYVFG